MKAIALVVVGGGVAYAYAPEHVDVRIVDLDFVKAGNGPLTVPSKVGFEELAERARLKRGVHIQFRKGA